MAPRDALVWTDEDEADIVRTERALERLRHRERPPVDGEHAASIRLAVVSCVRGLERMRELKERLTA